MNTENARIRIPLEDKHESSEERITKRCTIHSFRGKDIAYIMNLRMGGDAPRFGLYVTEGIN